MKEPVSLDLFPPDVCSSVANYVDSLKSCFSLRQRFLFLLRNRWEYYAYFSSSSCESYNSHLADLLEKHLGGLGGAW